MGGNVRQRLAEMVGVEKERIKLKVLRKPNRLYDDSYLHNVFAGGFAVEVEQNESASALKNGYFVVFAVKAEKQRTQRRTQRVQPSSERKKRKDKCLVM